MYNSLVKQKMYKIIDSLHVLQTGSFISSVFVRECGDSMFRTVKPQLPHN